MVIFAKKTVIGWEEWVSLPEIGLPLLKAKVDTGAHTSALHATNIKVVRRGEKRFVRFRINPVHKNRKVIVKCIAPLIDRRIVVDSGGHREKRYVISTDLVIGKKREPIEITLTNRKTMAFRMLLGRQAMDVAKLMVDPVKSCVMGQYSLHQVLAIYQSILEEKKIVSEANNEIKNENNDNENSNTGLQP